MFSSSALEVLLTAGSPGPDSDDEQPGTADRLFTAARTEGLLPTVVAACLQEGRPVPAALRIEAGTHVERARRYRAVERFLGDRVGPLRVLKGRHVAAHYPAGWQRASTDLDLEVAGAREVFAAAGSLLPDGWTPNRLSVFTEDGAIHPAVDLVGSRHREPLGRDLVQIQSPCWYGAGPTSPPRAACAPLAALDDAERALVEIVGVTARKGVTARNVLDVAVLTAHTGRGPVSAALEAVGLTTQWRTVEHAVGDLRRRAGCNAGPGPDPLPAPAFAAPAGPEHAVPLDGPPDGRRAPATAADALAAGLRLSGRIERDSDRGGAVTLSPERTGDILFRCPLGSGVLRWSGR